MTTVTTDRLSLVRAMRLPTDDDLGPLLDKLKRAPDASKRLPGSVAAGESAEVNAGSLTSFTEKLSGQNRSDVKNSTLFAQLAANKAYDRYKQPMDWYRKYVDVLGLIGWNQPAFNFDDYHSKGSTVQLDQAVLGILAAIATAQEVAIVKATMDGLKALGDESKQMLIWDANSNNGDAGNFQIFPADTTPNGDVVMILDGMQFNASSSHTRFLWWTWDTTSIQIKRAASKFVLNEDVYGKVRQAIIDKLGDRAVQLVAEIPI